MIPIKKLAELSPGHRRRKLDLSLEALERGIRRGDDIDLAYLNGLITMITIDTGLGETMRKESQVLSQNLEERLNRGNNTFSDRETLSAMLLRTRRNLEREIGKDPADWDFLAPDGSLDPQARKPFEGVKIYLEDIRSPFNVGSIFRSADAFGVQEIMISPLCADPDHVRSRRVSMGTSGSMTWRRMDAQELSDSETLIALELGGTALDEFSFPAAGVLVLGSEELGISPPLLTRCKYRISIPMRGAKASINVGVAFGIAMHAWAHALATAQP